MVIHPSYTPDLIVNFSAFCKHCPLSFWFTQSPEILWIPSSCCPLRVLAHAGPRVHPWLTEGGLGSFLEVQESRRVLKLLFLLQHVFHCRMLSPLRTLSKLITLGKRQVMRDPEQILRSNYEWLNWRHPEVPSSQCACEFLKLNYPVWSSQ